MDFSSASSSITTGGFKLEVDSLRRSRLTLVSTVGAAMLVVLEILELAYRARGAQFLEVEPRFLHTWPLHFHTATFVIAAVLTRVKSLETQTILALDLLLFASNIVVRSIATIGVVSTGDHFPGIEGILLALVLHGVFVPTKTIFAVLLTVAAVVSFIFSQWFGYEAIEAVKNHWLLLGRDTFLVLVAINALMIGFFGFLSVLSSKIFYGLAKNAYAAKRLGNYLIESELSQGGMGKVLVGRHATMKRPTAVKILNPETVGGEEALGRFAREVELSSQLTHPNTISIYDFGRGDDGTFYYAMELLRGMDLKQFVERYGPMGSDRVIFLMKQVCGSLEEAHAKGIIHRDVKPSNIFLTNLGGMYDFVKVIDFGLAKQILPQAAGSAVTQKGGFIGTPHYLAPEVIQGKAPALVSADMYALGAVMFFLLVGENLFDGDMIEVLSSHVRDQPRVPSSCTEIDVPEELDRVILRCLEKNPGDRFDSAKSLAAALSRISLAESWSYEKAQEWWATRGNPF